MASSSSSKTLILISSDGHEFQVAEGAAVLSITLKNMVEDDCANNPIPIREIDGKTLSKVIVYLRKHDARDVLSDEEKKAFDKDFLAEEVMGELLDLIQVPNYLHIKGLLDIVAQKIANLIKNKSVEWVRDTFGIENDFTPEEEEAVTRRGEARSLVSRGSYTPVTSEPSWSDRLPPVDMPINRS